jgi:copper homeostasis protein
MKKKADKMKKFTLEVCADSVESVLAAQEGGADRIELCQNIVIGGTSPSESLFLEVKKNSDIRIHVLLRPRFGDFYYTEHEFQILKSEVKRFRELGADGVVIGMLKPDGTLDVEHLKELVDEAGEMSVTLHRAFDVCRNPMEALEQAISLGFDTILTSGQEDSCEKGTALLKTLEEKSAGRIQIMAGAGISADVIQPIYEQTGITTYHMTGKTLLESEMKYRKDNVKMGLPFLSEFEIYRTDKEKIRQARNVISRLENQ